MTASTRQFHRSLALSFLFVLFIAGCKVGPNYVRPQVTAPPTYRGADNAAVPSADPESLADQDAFLIGGGHSSAAPL